MNQKLAVVVRGTWLLMALAFMLPGVSFCAPQGQELASWTCELTNATYSIAGDGCVAVTFPAPLPNNPPTLRFAYLLAGGWSGSSTYGGNYTAAGVKGVMFSIKSQSGSAPGSLILRMKTKIGLDSLAWDNPAIAVADGAGRWKVNAKFLARSDGWKSNPGLFNTDTWFSNSLQNVEFIGVRIAPSTSSTNEESYSVDNFTLYGDGFAAWASNLVPLQNVLDYFGVPGIADVPMQQDRDGDGMSDFLEIVAGTDPDVKEAVFNAEIVSVTKDSVVLRWPSLADGKYTLLQSADLQSGFVPLQSNISGGTGSHTYYTNAVVSHASRFYRVMKQ